MEIDRHWIVSKKLFLEYWEYLESWLLNPSFNQLLWKPKVLNSLLDVKNRPEVVRLIVSLFSFALESSTKRRRCVVGSFNKASLFIDCTTLQHRFVKLVLKGFWRKLKLDAFQVDGTVSGLSFSPTQRKRHKKYFSNAQQIWIAQKTKRSSTRTCCEYQSQIYYNFYATWDILM